MRKVLKYVSLITTGIIFISLLGVIIFVSLSLSSISLQQIQTLTNKPKSVILDENNTIIETVNHQKNEDVTYEELPTSLVNALLSIEDINFFQHNGVDYSRTLKAFVHNIFSSSKQGGSTITQQLVKNTILNNEQTYKRKIQEAYLAFNIEQQFSKEKILETYFNRVYFEPTVPGVAYASKRYFGKSTKTLSLPECALLAGLVKSGSYYNPIKHPDRAQARKNVVLQKMFEYNFISKNEYEESCKVQIDDIIIPQGFFYNDPTYDFQAYLDIVYKEIESLGYSLYSNSIKVETYMDSNLQKYLDQIQSGKIISFTDDEQQIGGAVINNDDGTIAGVIGGRNYQGMRLFSRSYDLRRQPASTIKPIFEYALAAEYLGFNGATNIIDEPFTYPGTNYQVNNADKTYAGNLSMTDALGYSKNTCALSTLSKVQNYIGIDKTISYLNEIGIMDEGPYSMSYGIGGMSYGVSPVQLAGAYAMLVRDGKYVKPTTIRRITDLSTSQVVYENEHNEKQIISKEAAFQVANSLFDVVKNNYYNINTVQKNSSITVGAKTGTNGYDSSTARKLNFPTYADKDSWVAGFSASYTMAVWSGFDQAPINSTNYFGRNDARRRIPKYILGSTLEYISTKKENISVPDSLTKINVVKYADNYYLPNELVPMSYITSAYFTQKNIPCEILPYPEFYTIANVKAIKYDDCINLFWEVEDDIKEDRFPYSKVFGDKGFIVEYEENNTTVSLFTNEKQITLESITNDCKSITITSSYKEKGSPAGVSYVIYLNL